MGLRGPPKKANQFKVIQGTTRLDRMIDPLVIDGELLDELPPAPTWLTDDLAIEEWNRLGPVLVRCKMLNDGNLTAFGALCMTFGRGVQGDDKSMNQYIRLVSEFGLTPASRGRVKVHATKDEKPTGFARFKNQESA